MSSKNSTKEFSKNFSKEKKEEDISSNLILNMEGDNNLTYHTRRSPSSVRNFNNSSSISEKEEKSSNKEISCYLDTRGWTYYIPPIYPKILTEKEIPKRFRKHRDSIHHSIVIYCVICGKAFPFADPNLNIEEIMLLPFYDHCSVHKENAENREVKLISSNEIYIDEEDYPRITCIICGTKYSFPDTEITIKELKKLPFYNHCPKCEPQDDVNIYSYSSEDYDKNKGWVINNFYIKRKTTCVVCNKDFMSKDRKREETSPSSRREDNEENNEDDEEDNEDEVKRIYINNCKNCTPKDEFSYHYSNECGWIRDGYKLNCYKCGKDFIVNFEIEGDDPCELDENSRKSFIERFYHNYCANCPPEDPEFKYLLNIEGKYWERDAYMFECIICNKRFESLIECYESVNREEYIDYVEEDILETYPYYNYCPRCPPENEKYIFHYSMDNGWEISKYRLKCLECDKEVLFPKETTLIGCEDCDPSDIHYKFEYDPENKAYIFYLKCIYDYKSHNHIPYYQASPTRRNKSTEQQLKIPCHKCDRDEVFEKESKEFLRLKRKYPICLKYNDTDFKESKIKKAANSLANPLKYLQRFIEDAEVANLILEYTNKEFPNSNLENLNLRGADFVGFDLKNSKFGGCDLTNAKLTFGDFSDCDFIGANLTNTDMREGQFQKCRFSGCNLTRANFGGAFLNEIVLCHAILNGTNFSICILNGSINLLNSIIINSSFFGSTITELDFSKCSKMDKVNFRGANIEKCIFEKLKMFNMTFDYTTLGNSNFNGCDMKDSNFTMAEVIDCLFDSTDLSKTNLKKIYSGGFTVDVCER